MACQNWGPILSPVDCLPGTLKSCGCSEGYICKSPVFCPCGAVLLGLRPHAAQGCSLWLSWGDWLWISSVHPTGVTVGCREKQMLAMGTFLPGMNGTGYRFARRAHSGERLLGCCRCCKVASWAFHKVFSIARTPVQPSN